VIEDGLKKGADGKLKCVICEPVTGALTWDAYKTILNSHADCRVVVSVLGMPVGTAQPPAKTQGNVPTAKLIVFSEIGLHEDIAQRIAMGQISAAVIDCKNKAGVAELSKGGSTPALYGEVFHARYVLLDADNVGAVLKGQKPANHAR
jgi:hypothetical protein